MDGDAFPAADLAVGAKVSVGDFAALGALYAATAKLLPPGAPARRGRHAGAWPQVGAALGVTAVTLVTEELTVTGDTAQEIGRAEISVKGASAPARGRYVVFWTKEGGAWTLDADIWNMDE